MIYTLGQGLMRKGESRIRNVVFFVLALIFSVFVLALWRGRARELSFSILAAIAILFGLLGAALAALTVRLHENRTQKILFILTGVSAAGIPVCAALHNLVYGLFIELFGKGFWGPGGDEAVFFILAIFVCPALFLIGAAASGVLLIKARIAGNKIELQRGAAPNADKPRR